MHEQCLQGNFWSISTTKVWRRRALGTPRSYVGQRDPRTCRLHKYQRAAASTYGRVPCQWPMCPWRCSPAPPAPRLLTLVVGTLHFWSRLYRRDLRFLIESWYPAKVDPECRKGYIAPVNVPNLWVARETNIIMFIFLAIGTSLTAKQVAFWSSGPRTAIDLNIYWFLNGSKP